MNTDGSGGDVQESPTQCHKRPHTEGNAATGGKCAADGDINLNAPPPSKKAAITPDRISSDDEGSGSSGEESDMLENASTVKSNKWAFNHFTRWLEDRNTAYRGDSDNQVPVDLLQTADPKLLNRWLAVYATEARKQNSKPYPASTVYFLLAGLVRHMRSINPGCPNFLHTSNLQFKPLHDSLEETFRKLKANIVSIQKPAQPFSKEEEDRLWSSGALAIDNPKGLLRAVFFLNARNFGVHGGKKHRALKISQLKRVVHPPRYVFTETHEPSVTSHSAPSVGFASLKRKSQNKSSLRHSSTEASRTVTIDADTEKGNRCHVYILDIYLQKLPREAIDTDIFYHQPSLDPRKQWFYSNPVGRNTLSRLPKEICADAGIDGVRTLYGNLQTQGEHVSTSQGIFVVPPLSDLMVQGATPTQQTTEPLQNTSVNRTCQVPTASQQPTQPPAINQEPSLVLLPHVQLPTTPNQQQPPTPLPHMQSPTAVASPNTTNYPPPVSQASESTINLPVQGCSALHAIPQQLSFNNCHVTIYVTPPHPPPNT